ncbi:cholecystokinin receptor type A-like isoform X3 [Pomacea canaliculata]|uniref:cholecystokinin receptor type A-like isoform X3 n=1 Tax=Pomacea canaliculata TaxID=400727 RepID=UPI000D736BE0|nr:cholecystokinin receptor type A-like isoform X3 [Pomacea canaliculata]
MEINGSCELNPEFNICMAHINSSSSPETVFTTKKDVDKLSVELFQKILSSIILFSFLNCVGVPGNLFVFLVYLRKFKTSATRVFVMTMAMCDFLVNLSALPVNLVYYRHMYTISSPAFCTSTYLVLRIPVIVSYLVLVCASLDRRRRVCQPLRPQLDARQATMILILIFILTAIATFPFVSFYTGMHFTTTTGLTVRKCGFQREFPGAFVKRAEGIVLAVYFIFSLTLMVGSYVHILYRLKQQSKRLSQNLTSDGGQQETGLSVVSSISVRRTEEEVENTTYSYTESRDEERCVTRSVGGARELMSEDPSVSTIHPLQARSGTSVRVHQSRKLLASKTTLVLFVLTITTVVCLVPYLIWTAFPETVYGPQVSSWVINLRVTRTYLPSLRSTINPFIYLYFNPTFRLHFRQFLNF